MSNTQTENSKEKQLLLIDLWHVLVRYYYVIIIAIGISLGSALFYVNTLPPKFEYVSTSIIESSSFYIIDKNKAFVKKFIPPQVDFTNPKFLRKFFPEGDISVEKINSKFMEVQVVTKSSVEDSLSILLIYYELLKKEHQLQLDSRRNRVISELSIINDKLENLNQSLDDKILQAANIEAPNIDNKISNIKQIIKDLERLRDKTIINLEKILINLTEERQFLSSRETKLKNASENIADESKFDNNFLIQIMVNQERQQHLELSTLQLQEIDIQREIEIQRFKHINNIHSYKMQLSDLMLERDILIESTKDKFKQRKIEGEEIGAIIDNLMRSKSQLEFLALEENQTNIKFFGEVKQTSVATNLNQFFLLILSVLFGLGLGVILAFFINAIMINRKS